MYMHEPTLQKVVALVDGQEKIIEIINDHNTCRMTGSKAIITTDNYKINEYKCESEYMCYWVRSTVPHQSYTPDNRKKIEQYYDNIFERLVSAGCSIFEENIIFNCPARKKEEYMPSFSHPHDFVVMNNLADREITYQAFCKGCKWLLTRVHGSITFARPGTPVDRLALHPSLNFYRIIRK